MPLSVKEALESFGFIGELANAIPALKGIFTKAAKEEWPTTRLNLEIRDSHWFKTYGDAARSWITLQATDPATAKRNLLNAESKVRLMMNEMGLAKNGETYKGLAKTAIIQNMDDQQLKAYLAESGKLQYEDGVLSGNAGEMEQQMRQVFRSYGVGFTDDSLKHHIRMILAGNSTLEAWENLARARAKAAFPHFAQQIDMGYTVRDIADPYISTMANTLEMAETDIDLGNKDIKKALSQKDPSGANNAMPLWEFERKLKDDPRWDKTKQARNQAFDLVTQLGRDFGMVGR